MTETLDLHWEFSKLIPALQNRIEKLYSIGTIIQSHPLGFLRLALEGQGESANGFFLHVWMPGLPVQEGGAFMHQHVFDLSSRVLKGTLRDTLYKPVEDPQGPYQLIKGKNAQEYGVITNDVLAHVKMDVIRTLDVNAGEIYAVEKGQYHATDVDPESIVVTLIKKSNVDITLDPIVAVPNEVKISHTPYRKDNFDQSFAWDHVRKLFRECREGFPNFVI